MQIGVTCLKSLLNNFSKSLTTPTPHHLINFHRNIGTKIRSTTSTTNRKPIATRSPLTLTESAISRIKELLQKKPDAIGVKIGVRTRGCNGLSYTLDYCTSKAKFDEEVIQDGVTVVIDSKAQLTLLGTEMDYQEGKLSSEFVFYNPNIKGTCGCGESFNM